MSYKMDVDKFRGLSKWLDTFKLNKAHETSEELSDGIAVAEFLHQQESSFFTDEWMGRLVEDCEGNVTLKTNNLKKIVKQIILYFDTVHNIELASFHPPDVSVIGQSADMGEVAKLLQLALGVALHCDQKQAHVQAIRNMDESLQMVVMSAIQELLNGCQQKPAPISGEEYHEVEERLKETSVKLSAVEMERDELAQTKHDLEAKLQMKEEELEGLRQEMNEKTTAFEPGIPREVKTEVHLREVDHMRQELFKEKALTEDFRMRTEEAEQHIVELVQKNLELSSTVGNLSMLQDQLDEMKHLEEKVNRYEQMIATYKIKLEDATDIKRGMKSMEEKNTAYMQQILDLEEELRKMSSFKVQLKTYKQRIQELERSLLEERTERKAVSHNLESQTAFRQSLQDEVKHLQEMSKSTTAASLSSELAGRDDVDFPTGLSPLSEAFSPQLKEKMVRLEKENQIFKSRLADPSQGSVEEVAKLQAELEMARECIHQFESHSGFGSTATAPSSTQTKQLKLMEEEIETKSAEIEKLKKYLNKAKKIIENFGNKANIAEESGEIHDLKRQLAEKENYIQMLEKRVEETREVKEREEKLIVSAWYDLGMEMLQKQSEQRLIANMPFLAQQRQALVTRRGPSNQIPSSLGGSPSLRGNS